MSIEVESYAEIFAKMAKRIAANADHGFGGAVVIVPPDGDPVQFLVLDPKQDPAMFWANVKTKAEIALAEMDEKQRQQTMMLGGRR